MPKDNIERAIAKGSGTGADAAAYETVTYEGYGPGGVALFVEALTDNRNRTAADVRQAFTKSDGNLGESGSVAWLFERKGVILVRARSTRTSWCWPRPTPARTTWRPTSRATASRPRLRACTRCAPRSRRGNRRSSRPSRRWCRRRRGDRGRVDGAQGRPADGRAGGKRRRPGRLLELRHPGAGPRSRRGLARPGREDALPAARLAQEHGSPVVHALELFQIAAVAAHPPAVEAGEAGNLAGRL